MRPGYLLHAIARAAPWGEYVRPPGFHDWKPRGTPYLQLHQVGVIEGGFAGRVSGDEIADQLAEVAKTHNVRHVHSDQRESLFLGAALQRRGLIFASHDWSNASKQQAVTLVRRWLADHKLALPPDALELKRELLSFEEKVSPGGMLTFGARGSGHDDFVALLITLAHVELSDEHNLSKAPVRPTVRYARLPLH